MPISARASKTEKSDIWSLGSSIFNLVMGTQVFSGLGGKAQRKESEIPYMRKSMPELSALVIRCLKYNPADRPTAKEVVTFAEEHLSRIKNIKKIRPLKTAPATPMKDEYDCFWPEEMRNAL